MVSVSISPTFSTVPRLWPGETFVCVGSGPSLTQDDVDYCRGRSRVIAIKDTHRVAPWADVLYSGDERWWEHFAGKLTFTGRRFALVAPQTKYLQAVETAGAQLLRLGTPLGLERDPSKLALGNHSGFQAINLAIHLGAIRVVLLGYDMKASADGRDHFFGSHPYRNKPTPYQWLSVFDSILEPLRALGVQVLNATRDTALKCFPRCSIQEALA